MLNALKRWIGQARPAGSWEGAAQWAETAGYEFKRTRDGAGFVIDGAFDDRRWRLEWGPSQRFYIPGSELRLRMEVDAPGELQMLLLSRSLMRQLEEETFETFTDSLKTYADDSAPEEMRWLAMFGKLDAAALGALRPHIGAVALVPATAGAWLDGALGEQLLRFVAASAVGRDQPLVLMVQRGRLALRTALTEPQPQAIAAWISLFEVAARRVPAAVQALEGAVRGQSRRG